MVATPSGRRAAWSQHRTDAPSDTALRRFSAYLAQARSFYFAALGLDVLARPLAAYYSLLNLSKSWLTLQDPALTDITPAPAAPGKKRDTQRKLYHGASDQFDAAKTKYYFVQEKLQIKKSGVLAEIAARTGARFAYAAAHDVALASLAAYLPETSAEYELATAEAPRLVPIRSVTVMGGEADDSGTRRKALWLRAEINRDALVARNIAPSKLPARANHFGAVFGHVSSKKDTHSYESAPIFYSGPHPKPVLPQVTELFEKSLIHVDRTSVSGRFYGVLDARANLISQEAVTFLVMHHLSNMVRYRPEHLEKLASERWSWLLGTWVLRALENSLLTYASRITQREIRL